MKKLIAIWIAVVLSAGACTWQYNMTKGLSPFAQACAAISETACVGIEAPTVIISRAPLLIGAYGLYIKDENYVYVLSQTEMDKMSLELWAKRWPTVEEVVFHETIHYIMDRQLVSPNRCDSEELARELTSERFSFPVDPTWRSRYGCGKPQA